MKNQLNTLLSLLLFVGTSFAQVDFDQYSTLVAKGKIPEDFTKLTYNKLKDDLKEGRSELRKSQEKVFFEGTNYAIDEILHSGLVVYGDEITNYITEIADKLLKNDYKLRTKLRFYTLKSNTSNAFSTDQGIVFVTTGLIAQLSSEAQLAFVLAHEISHYTEKHVVASYEWRTKNSNDSRIERLSQYSKDKEFDADALGIKMYHEAGYSDEEIFTAFDVLMYSYLPFDEIELPKTYYNSKQLFIPTSLFPDKKFEIRAVEDYDDENSSHPNIKKRKENAEEVVGKYSNWGKQKQFLGDARFKTIRNIARFETVRSDVIDANFGDALYSIFILEKEFPKSIYLSRMKAQTWMNLMLYKAENISSKTIDKSNELEGESAAMHFFLRKLNKEALLTLSLREVYNIKKKYPNDEEINAIYNKLVKDLYNTNKFKIENYSKKTFSEAAEDFILAKSEPNKEVPAETETKKGSKYDRIKNKKNLDNAENFDSTKFYLYGISDIISDSNFLSLNDKYKAIASEKEKEKARYDALSKKEKKAFDKQKEAEDNYHGISEYIVVEPMVQSYKKGRVNNVKSEKLEARFSEAIEYSAQKANVTVHAIDSRTLEKKGTQGFNERSILISLLNQLSQENKLDVFPVDYQLLKTIQENYGTSKVLFSLVQHEYDAEIEAGAIVGSVILIPILFVYIPVGILSGNNTELSILVLDLEKGTVDTGVNYYFKDAPKKIQLGAHMYDIFRKMGTSSK